MRFQWLTLRISLLLSVLSVLTGYIGAFAAGKHYMLLVLTIPAVLLFIITLQRWQNVRIPEDSYMDGENADIMVATAVRPTEYPLCAHLTVTHTNGVSIAAIAARAVFTSIKYLQGMLIQREKEMQGELMFTPDVVETHLRRLRRIQAITAGLVSGGNFLVQCYCRIPNSTKIVKSIDSVRIKLDRNIVEKIEEFCKGIPKEVNRHEEVEPWRSRIKQLIKVETPSESTEVLDILFKVEEPAKNLLRSLEIDWQRDLRFLSVDTLCKPRPEPVPKAPAMVPSSLFSSD